MYELKISKKTLLELLYSLPCELPEMGGIIGGTKKEITEYWIDAVQSDSCACKYTPNVGAINKKIEIWSKNNIDFYGLFHTHYFGVKTLSEGDVAYMRKIMNAMPSYIEMLYFPIVVFPNREMILYGIKNQTMEIMKCNYCIV